MPHTPEQSAVLQPAYWGQPGEVLDFSDKRFADSTPPDTVSLRWYAARQLGVGAVGCASNRLAMIAHDQTTYTEHPQMGDLNPHPSVVPDGTMYALTRERLAHYSGIPADSHHILGSPTALKTPLSGGLIDAWVRSTQSRTNLISVDFVQKSDGTTRYGFIINDSVPAFLTFFSRAIYGQPDGSVLAYMQESYAAVLLTRKGGERLLVPFSLSLVGVRYDQTVAMGATRLRAHSAIPLPLANLDKTTTYTGQGLDDPALPEGVAQRTYLRQRASQVVLDDSDDQSSGRNNQNGEGSNRVTTLKDIVRILLPRQSPATTH